MTDTPSRDAADGLGVAGSEGCDVPLEVSDLSADEVVDALRGLCSAVDRAEADKLTLVLHYVDLHPVTSEHPAAGWNLDEGVAAEQRPRQVTPLAGAGTPGIGEYALEALGPVLGLGYGATKAYVASAVELRYRLPRLWTLVRARRLQAWRALRVAEVTPTLAPHVAEFVDRHVAVIGCRNKVPGPGQLKQLVHEALLQCDPDAEKAREEAALADRDVRFDHHAGTGVSELWATLDLLDALDLDTSSANLAATLGRLGDTDPIGVRRSRALGTLADPQRTLDLYGDPHRHHGLDEPDAEQSSTSAAVDGRDATAAATEAAAADPPAAARGTAAAKYGEPRATGWNRTTAHLYLHLCLTDLAGLGAVRTSGPDGALGPFGRVGIVERIGPVSAHLAADWWRRSQSGPVRVVLHTNAPAGSRIMLAPDQSNGGAMSTAAATTPVDVHDPPLAMRESVLMRDGICGFPGCRVDARRCDVDHIVAYVPLDEGGPPGQTSLENLACLCRRHHRLKTFTAWTYERLPDGRYRWGSPLGHVYYSAPEPGVHLPRQA